MATQGLRERKKARTRESIAAVALALFAERGYDNVTVAELAEAAEVSKGTLFAYFSTKEEIVFADTALGHEGILFELAHRTRGLSALETMRVCVINHLEHPSPHARTREKLIEANDVLRVHYRAQISAVEDALAAGIAADLGEQPDALRPRIMASGAMAAFTVAKERAYRIRNREAALAEANAVLDEAFAMLLHGTEPRT